MSVEGVVRDGRGAGLESVQAARFQNKEAGADALEDVGLVLDEEDVTGLWPQKAGKEIE